MAYARRFFILLFLLSLAGCCSLASKVKKESDYEQGYRVGVKENIHDFAQSFYGNEFPYFYWQSPIVQNVVMPAHIENGIFIPEHNELVMIEPGQWRKRFGYSIRGAKNKSDKTEGEDYALKYFDFDSRDITVFPESYAGDKPGNEVKDSR
ncbi:hypothetical protein BU251_02515 [Candidatus Velamenicoccus archaeovorus]|uniref:Uncharacterized protein n=1 Tax=Velamenicoccus archaeovorus TaxID=1930593 RepID=A0A410P3K3_VELA1|nr:hypothetical protein [Candidatus Velamenicoccus archaeovorus]QAT16682.1 hypothetical protein BU251_02515 [Candidatus Velamenicoccus archaeovorus]